MPPTGSAIPEHKLCGVAERKMMIKIGDFSRISKVSIKTLRHYEHVGLLRPSHIDNVSGYRYYSARQLPRLTRILFFKKLGFSLTQIQTLLREDPSSLSFREILHARRGELLDNMREEKSRLAQVETLLKRIEGEGTFQQPELLMKQMPASLIGSIRSMLSNYAELDGLFSRLDQQIPRAGRVPGRGAIWHRCLHTDGMIDCEAFVFLRHQSSGQGNFMVRELPSETVGSIIYDGSEETLPMVYATAIESIDASNHEVKWPMRELYFSTAGDFNYDVIEIQFPVQPNRLPNSGAERPH